MTDCHTDKSISDICAVIRHHILDQVTSVGAAPLVSARQNAVADARLSTRPNSTPPYGGVRGTK